MPNWELEEILHPRKVQRDRKADQFTFRKHIVPARPPLLQRMRDKIALRTRIKSVLSNAHAVS